MTFLKPLFRHIGSKADDIKIFSQYFPKDIDIYVEPFLGGGSVYLNIEARNYIISDFDERLMHMWMYFDIAILKETHDPNILSKMSEQEAYEYMCKFYYDMRERYNANHKDWIATFFVKQYCFSGMDRYNKSGGFNVPFGGRTYVNKNPFPKQASLDAFRRKRHSATIMTCSDYRRLGKLHLTENSFVFLDPPYTTTFSSYNNTAFTIEDHKNLKNILTNLKCKFMLIINKDEFTQELYKDFKQVEYFKKYKIKFKDRNESGSFHLIITNY